MLLLRVKFLSVLSLVPLSGALRGLRASRGNSASKTGAPNFIILLFDALSAEHLPIYGYPRQTAPQLARFADVPARDVGYAGLKDRHAVTEQWLSVPEVAPSTVEAVTLPDVEVLEAAAEKLVAKETLGMNSASTWSQFASNKSRYGDQYSTMFQKRYTARSWNPKSGRTRFS